MPAKSLHDLSISCIHVYNEVRANKYAYQLRKQRKTKLERVLFYSLLFRDGF